jgi:cell division septum initiation protein DivIVA
MLDTTARFRASPDVVSRDIPDGLMLVNVQTGAAFKLNQVGAAVWRRLDGASDLATIVADLDRQYQVGAERLLADVNALLADLQKQGLVGPVDPL